MYALSGAFQQSPGQCRGRITGPAYADATFPGGTSFAVQVSGCERDLASASLCLLESVICRPSQQIKQPAHQVDLPGIKAGGPYAVVPLSASQQYEDTSRYFISS